MMRKKLTFPRVSEIERYAKRNAFVLKGKVIKPKSRTGRPSVMTQEVVRKLEHAFVYDCTVEEACFYAGISRDTYYSFCKQYPDFSDRIALLRHAVPLVLKKRVVIAAIEDANLALKYLERKYPQEWGLKSYVHHSGETTDLHAVDAETKELIQKAMGNFAKKVSKDEKSRSKQSKPLSLFEPNQQS